MKTIKRFIYKKLVYYYYDRMCSLKESFDLAHMEGDHRGMEYCDKRFAKCLEKEEKYSKKLEALWYSKEEP